MEQKKLLLPIIKNKKLPGTRLIFFVISRPYLHFLGSGQFFIFSQYPYTGACFLWRGVIAIFLFFGVSQYPYTGACFFKKIFWRGVIAIFLFFSISQYPYTRACFFKKKFFWRVLWTCHYIQLLTSNRCLLVKIKKNLPCIDSFYWEINVNHPGMGGKTRVIKETNQTNIKQ